MKAAADASLDKAVDALFAGANDLVINTPYAWGIGRGPNDLTSLPQFLPKNRVLCIDRRQWRERTSLRLRTA